MFELSLAGSKQHLHGNTGYRQFRDQQIRTKWVFRNKNARLKQSGDYFFTIEFFGFPESLSQTIWQHLGSHCLACTDKGD
jgi:hypothetical protein